MADRHEKSEITIFKVFAKVSRLHIINESMKNRSAGLSPFEFTTV